MPLQDANPTPSFGGFGLRQSEARQELADLLEKDPDSEKIGERNVEMRSLDRQIVAHKITKPEPETKTVTGTPEGREMRQLVNRASLGKMMAGIADDGQGNQNKLLVGPETYAHMGATIFDAGSGMNVVDKLMSVGVNILVTDNAGAYSANDQDGLVIVGPPRRNSVGVTWGGVEVVVDNFSLAPEGQLKYTILVMWDFENVRPAGYVRKSYRRS